MSDHANFIAAILASPDDDGPRLVHADYLEEEGEVERAEFIRAQIKREYGYTNVKCYPGSRRPMLESEYRRGFVHTIRGPLAAILEHGPGICAVEPVQAVEVTDDAIQHLSNHGVSGWYYSIRTSTKGQMMSFGHASRESASGHLNAAVLATIRERARGMVAA